MTVVHTESGAVYELHTDPTNYDLDQVGTIVRRSTAGGTTNGVPVDHLRKDSQPIPVISMSRPTVGYPWVLLLQIRDDGVLTERITTPVVRLTESA